MRISSNKERGSVLVTTLIITGLVTLTVAALLTVVKQQNYFAARSATWCSEIPIAEAGIEEAMAHINMRLKRWDTNLWVYSPTNGYSKTRPVGNDLGYFYTVISTSKPPSIVSIGYGRIPLQTGYTHRSVMVMTKENPLRYGIISKGVIKMGGSTVVDSYDSTDPAHSNNGRYDPTERLDHAYVATLSSAVPAIMQGKIYGTASTGPLGSATGTIGDGAWQATHTGVQPGHLTDDFNMAIPNAALPTNFNPGLPLLVLPPTMNVAGDFKLNNGFSGQVTINKKVRLWITGNVKIMGGDFIKITPTGSLELYLSGASVEFGGNGVINNNASASTCQIYGLPTCLDLRFRGGAEITAQVYAPNADVDLGGTPDFFGSLVGKTLELSGNAGVHYDEALGNNNGPPFAIVRWEEL
jgi:hypothetical protein